MGGVQGLLRPSVLLQQRLSKLWRDMNVRYTQVRRDPPPLSGSWAFFRVAWDQKLRAASGS